jgi:hypothetical protein
VDDGLKRDSRIVVCVIEASFAGPARAVGILPAKQDMISARQSWQMGLPAFNRGDNEQETAIELRSARRGS